MYGFQMPRCELRIRAVRLAHQGHDFLLAIHTALPEATARAHDHDQETKHEIDRNDVADLIQLLSGVGVCLPFDGLAKTAPRRKEQVQEQQYHHNAHALHEVDMYPGAREPAEI